MRFLLVLLSHAVFGLSLPEKRFQDALVRTKRQEATAPIADDSITSLESTGDSDSEVLPTISPTEDMAQPSNATEQTVPLTTVAVVVVSVNTTDVTEDAQPQSTQPIMIEPAEMTTQTPVVVKETTEKKLIIQTTQSMEVVETTTNDTVVPVVVPVDSNDEEEEQGEPVATEPITLAATTITQDTTTTTEEPPKGMLAKAKAKIMAVVLFVFFI